ncbi:FAD:protein FMN transferase [Dactylosporangium matsuzakiense]|uniref:FAD:protein FMN transferase n=1 Tax=Dactylosporangium matsuzakiense TaxID=53360 RepID=A0A9W6KL86_9ACTN|nr:FAD:protein FMN transferase [Dactylosporangium matsuzakiense]UWZ48297.1 FAD:protein FMN transferase [Dactylosporangium matsuzakiense]GLL01539.1 hypothetical protein GCM10017581_032800 [Dactylosporangium matsuzakiense]
MKQRAYVEQIMGLPVSIHVRGPEPDSAGVRRRVELVFADLRHADAVFSPYRDDSELARWQRQEPVTDPGFPVVLALCDEARARTEGWFDPRELPDPRTGAPRFDPSGLVKGWAVQEASQHLEAVFTI